MIVTLVRSVIVSAIILLGMWLGSLWVYDHEKTSDALLWRWAELNGEAVYSWPFDLPDEIYRANGIRSFDWSDGILTGDHADPYFYLNLEGRNIDARRFNQLRLVLNSPAEANLRLFHFQGDEDVIHASDLIPVSAGWQTIELSLAEIPWHARVLSRADAPVVESSWGGDRGLVTEFRIDPVEDGAFGLDVVELIDSINRPPLVDEIETFENSGDELFDRMRQDPARTWHIAHDSFLRTPETAHRLRLKIAEQFPSAILFPHPPTREELVYPPFEPEAFSPFIPAVCYIAALLFIVVRDQFPHPWRSLVAVMALVALAEAYIYWASALAPLWRTLLAIPILGAFWELVPRCAPRYLYQQARAWVWVSPLLLISLLILAWALLAGHADVSVARILVVYFLWALAQQFVVAVLVLGRLKPVFGPAGIVIAAGVFGFLHFPNFALMAATFLLGLFLLYVYDRFQNLIAISAAHAMLAVSFQAFAEQYLWLSSVVGPAFTAGL